MPCVWSSVRIFFMLKWIILSIFKTGLFADIFTQQRHKSYGFQWYAAYFWAINDSRVMKLRRLGANDQVVRVNGNCLSAFAKIMKWDFFSEIASGSCRNALLGKCWSMGLGLKWTVLLVCFRKKKKMKEQKKKIVFWVMLFNDAAVVRGLVCPFLS